MTATNVSGYTDSRGRKVSSYSQQRQSASYQPKHRISGKMKIATGLGGLGASGVGFLSSGFNFGSSLLNFGAAMFTVAGTSLLAWGGYKGARKYRAKRKGRGRSRKAAGFRTRFGTVKLTSERDVDAFIKLQKHRQEQWRSRRAAAGRAARTTGHAVAKVVPHKKEATP
jgi:hypothetical protein